MKTCPYCAEDIQDAAKVCKHCGRDLGAQGATPPTTVAKTPPANAASAVVSLVIFLAVLWFYFGGGLERKVASDVIDQYNIARRTGSAMDVCVHAGIVAAAYLQAKDEVNYSKWKATENSDCRAAGLSR